MFGSRDVSIFSHATPRMEPRFQTLLTTTFANPKTRESYASRLRALVKNVGAEGLFDILVTPNKWYPKIQTAYPSLSTRKNLITAILVLFREDKELQSPAHAEAAARWRKLHEDLGRHQDARVRRSEPAEKQVAQYTSFEEIEAKYEELRRGHPHTTRRKSLQFLLLSVFVHLRPKRADLGSVTIFNTKDPNRTDINYVVLRTKGTSFLVMNMYKTSKYYQTVEEDLPEGLVRDIRTSLGRWPREHLFVKEDGEAMSNNTYTKFVQATFQDLFGRSTGVSLLRHIYITEKLDFDNMTLEEQNAEAKLMLHTTGLQRQYKWPKKVICPKLCGDWAQEQQTQPPTTTATTQQQNKRRPTKRAPRANGRRPTRRQAKSPTSDTGPV
jgi:hypothetical protein